MPVPAPHAHTIHAHAAPARAGQAHAALMPPIGAPTGTARLFLARDVSYAAHGAAYGSGLPVWSPDAFVDELRRSELDGRGGAGFPVWRKLAAVQAATKRKARRSAVVVGNGSEGEPLSHKDETLLRQAPHLVIDGLLLCAAAVGASTVSLVVGESTAAGVRRALAERGDAAHVTVTIAPEAFVAGEATALVNTLERGVSVPRDHVVHLSQSGLGGRPTLVQNVETLAQIALIARFGAQWFRSVGTVDEPGTRLVTVSGDVDLPQVLEVAGGTPVSVIVAACMAGAGAPAPASAAGGAGALTTAVPRAVLVGGYHGGWVPRASLDVALSRSELPAFGAAPGAGVLFVLGEHRCGLAVAAEIAGYLAGQSARQCGPCVNGLPALASVLGRVAARSRDGRLPAEVARLADLVTGRGSCSHPDGTARFVLSSMTAFDSDVRAHLEGRCEVMHR